MTWAGNELIDNSYQVSTEVYEGPLDLLLDLIEREELDITVVSLAQVTDQFLSYLARIEYRDASEVSSFLVVATKLIQIKSLALLPQTKSELLPVEDEDPGEALTRQLIEYKKFKQAAAVLENRLNHNWRTFLRLAPSPKIQGKVDLEGFTLNDLILAAQEIFSKDSRIEPLGSIVSIPRLTIHDRILFIRSKFNHRQKITFSSLLSDDFSRMNIVVTFLALLELVRRQMITAFQNLLFGEISLVPSSELDTQPITADDFTDE